MENTMSDFECPVMKIGPLLPHGNADSLSLVKVFGFQVVVRTADWAEGDLAVYVPEDAVVPFEPQYDYIHGGADDQRHRRVRAKRLRGVYSEGLLLKVPEGLAVEVGDDLSTMLGIGKYTPPAKWQEDAGPRDPKRRDFRYNDLADYGLVEFTKVKNVNWYGDAPFADDDIVEIEEKIHGANARYAMLDLPVAPPADARWYVKLMFKVREILNREIKYARHFVIASHRMVKKVSEVFTTKTDFYGGAGWWQKAAEEFRVEQKLWDLSDEQIVVFGEVYGPGVQWLGYGVDNGKVGLVVFDLYNPVTKRYQDDGMRRNAITALGLTPPPLLFSGTFAEAKAAAGPNLEVFRDGPSALGGVKHIKEGIVVRRVIGSNNGNQARQLVKYISPAYLLKKEPDESES